ncbi:DUF2796 domain-containing protein [Litorivicinus lipolyticus]|uniref:DUF2796 domain-containing protein n=1 Tax=Litorivicinus lipolyticus TaxID=418701 RepID=A0A5Q2QCB2_9GAMM|nr:DUF2796 domain-containing protein [Litorivicinus lipolyticus]QGG79627.1 DUF2796 domain-containing protein [Litorivicinus lipolyticus]
MHTKFAQGLSLVGALLSAPVLAGGGHHHGEGHMQVALDGAVLDVNLVLPKADFGTIDPRGRQLLAAPSGQCVARAIQMLDTDLGDGHADITLAQTYDCAAPTSLSSIELSVFAWAPSLQEIELTYLSARHQVSQTVSDEQPAVLLGD